MKFYSFSKVCLGLLVSIGLAGCGDFGDDFDDGDIGDIGGGDAPTVLTGKISFEGGTVVSGQPPEATNNSNDPVVDDSATDTAKWNPGTVGSLSVDISNIPPNQSFNVNIQFGSTTNSFIQIPISDTSLLDSIAANNGAGTLNLPFAVPTSICDNIGDIQHQIQCYESVDLGNGTIVSQQVAQQMILACDDASGVLPTSCGSNTLQQDCQSLDNQTGIIANFAAGSSCSQAFPLLTEDGAILDTGCSGYTQGDVLPDLYDATDWTFNGVCGACAYDVDATASSLKPGVDTGDQQVDAAAEIMKQISEYATNPKLARKKITFTP